MQKIDFFGGLHGNFLELIVNVFINQNGYDISTPQFDLSGACHLKNNDSKYKKIIIAKHFSYFNVLPLDNDCIVRIVPTQDDMLIGLTNSFLRSGGQSVDIDNLEIDTINKLTKISKGANFAKTITQDFGTHTDYPRHAIRNYFYSMLSDHETGLGMFVNFTPFNNVHEFPFRAFFESNYFYTELNEIAKFLNLNFYPTVDLGLLHKNFLKANQGYHSELKCKQIWLAILEGRPMEVDLNLIEEAWINHQVAKTFRCYDHPLLSSDQYPTNTLEISHAIFEWKDQDR